MKKLNGGRQINAKMIRIALKKNWTLRDFMENYKITEETFWELIRELFHGDTSEVKRCLKRNESMKKSSSKIKKNQKAYSEDVQEIEQGEESKPDSEETIKMEESENFDEDLRLEDSEKLQAQENLKLLIEREQKRVIEERQKIIFLEINHKELISRKRAIQTKELPELKEVLESYKKKIEEAQTQVISLNEELTSIMAEINNVNETLSNKREELKNLEDEISALQVVNIFVYSTGEIEISASTDVEIPGDEDIDWVSIVTNNGEQCKVLTIAQIQSVAKTLCIVKELKSWQTVFENEACQKLFDSLVAMQQSE